MLCSVAVTVTLNGVPALSEAGADTLTPVTFASVVVVMLVLALPEPALLLELESET